MKKIKERFQEDPAFAVFVLVVAVTTASMMMKSTAKMIEASAYAYQTAKR